jgi:hypothetical protein
LSSPPHKYTQHDEKKVTHKHKSDRKKTAGRAISERFIIKKTRKKSKQRIRTRAQEKIKSIMTTTGGLQLTARRTGERRSLQAASLQTADTTRTVGPCAAARRGGTRPDPGKSPQPATAGSIRKKKPTRI